MWCAKPRVSRRVSSRSLHRPELSKFWPFLTPFHVTCNMPVNRETHSLQASSRALRWDCVSPANSVCSSCESFCLCCCSGSHLDKPCNFGSPYRRRTCGCPQCRCAYCGDPFIAIHTWRTQGQNSRRSRNPSSFSGPGCFQRKIAPSLCGACNRPPSCAGALHSGLHRPAHTGLCMSAAPRLQVAATSPGFKRKA